MHAVVKPVSAGSSVGISIVRAFDDLEPAIEAAFKIGDEVLIEEFIPGREITVAVMGDKALGVTEITSDRGFYDYTAKYAPGGSRHIVPAQLSAEAFAEAQRLALATHNALGCRGVSRTDLRYDDSTGEGKFYVLEVNTQPGMTATSLVPEQAEVAGISFVELVTWMVENATCDA